MKPDALCNWKLQWCASNVYHLFCKVLRSQHRYIFCKNETHLSKWSEQWTWFCALYKCFVLPTYNNVSMILDFSVQLLMLQKIPPQTTNWIWCDRFNNPSEYFVLATRKNIICKVTYTRQTWQTRWWCLTRMKNLLPKLLYVLKNNWLFNVQRWICRRLLYSFFEFIVRTNYSLMFATFKF